MVERKRVAGAIGIMMMAVVGTALMPLSQAAAVGEDLIARVENASGQGLGTVRFSDDDGKVVVKAQLSGLSEGFHGFHVHAVGVCTPAGFTSAGGHHNPGGGHHGSHAGDMPPLLAAADGTAQVKFTTDRITLASLMDANGSSVVVHSGPDNLAHMPATTATGGDRYYSFVDEAFGPDALTRATGDAGSRFGCGEIKGS